MTVRRLASLATVVGFGLTLAAGLASAQRADNNYGAYPRGPNPYTATKPKAATQPGQFDYYALSLSWSPSYCAGLQRDGYDPQCHRRDGKRYAFVLHGLWPQYTRGWPQDCPTADRGFVPRPVAQRMLDIMPSEKLVFHEYRKHGTCSGLGVDGYFDLSRKLFEKVKIPAQFHNVNDPRFFISPGDLAKAFQQANPTLKPDAIAIDCGGPGNRLKEVRVCFDKQGEFQSCGRNENQARMCSADRMYVPPVREGGPTFQQRLRNLVPGAGQRI
jgi:ribonuclease T2